MFITLEGIDGSGKTSQTKHIIRFLESKGYSCIATREPGGTRIGKKIRDILLDCDNIDIDPLAELLLYTADRVQHINSFIKPLIEAGKIVVCDRYVDSTTAYQGYARGIDISLINKLNKIAFNELKPNLTILLDIDAEISLERAKKNIETRFEKESIEFHKKVRAGFLALANNEPDRFCIINANQPKNVVCEQIIQNLSMKL